MENYSKGEKNIVNETRDLFIKYSKERESWATHAQEDREFRLGKQWKKEQRDILEARGQAAIVVNRIHPAVETAKAMLTSNRPSFRCSAREDSDNKVATVFNTMLEYVYDKSDGQSVLRNVVDDYYVSGMGCMLVYQDPNADDGKGEIKMRDIDPLDVYVDPNSRSRFCDDAESIIVSRLFSKSQARKMYPMYESKIKNASSDVDWAEELPDTGREDDSETSFPGQHGQANDDYVRGYERYSKIAEKKYKIFERHSGQEKEMNEAQFSNYKKSMITVVDGQVFPHNPDLKEAEVLNSDLIKKGVVDVVEVPQIRIKQCVIIGDKLLYERFMPIDEYPVVFFMNIHTRTPYPTSDVRMVKNLQEYINKVRSLIIAHMTTSTNTKILVPSGSVDMKDFEEKWAQPGVAIEVDFDMGQPVPVQPTPIPNELYSNEMNAKADIDHQLGLYEMMQGNSSAAPQTYKATIALDEFGQRKIKSKMADIEMGLVRAGKIAISLMQQLYTKEKVFRVVQPNNSISEVVINKKLVDDKQQEIGVFNDISVGQYDLIVVAGSTMPSNRWAELELYMDAYSKGIIDRNEVLKKTEVFDMEGVLERVDMIQKLQGEMQSAQEQIKNMNGDIQTKDREIQHLRNRVETEKFKTKLDGQTQQSKAAGKIFEKRLDDTLANVKQQLRAEMAIAKAEAKDTSGKSSSNKGKN
tara:strand:+ start:793 stop:2877 length:2085 start_codon:yes stop_codon:yes gene_type:complete